MQKHFLLILPKNVDFNFLTESIRKNQKETKPQFLIYIVVLFCHARKGTCKKSACSWATPARLTMLPLTSKQRLLTRISEHLVRLDRPWITVEWKLSVHLNWPWEVIGRFLAIFDPKTSENIHESSEIKTKLCCVLCVSFGMQLMKEITSFFRTSQQLGRLFSILICRWPKSKAKCTGGTVRRRGERLLFFSLTQWH